MTLSTAVKVLKVSSAKSLCPDVKNVYFFFFVIKAKTEVETETLSDVQFP
jgi:hypothetical protein